MIFFYVQLRRLSCDTCWFVHNSPFQIITFLHYHCSLKFDCIWGELEIKLYQEYKVFCTWANRLILVTEMKYLSFICLINRMKIISESTNIAGMNLILFSATFWNYHNLWHTSMKQYCSIQILWLL